MGEIVSNSSEKSNESVWKKTKTSIFTEIVYGSKVEHSTDTFSNESKITISESTAVERLNVGITDRSTIEFIEIIFSKGGERGVDQYYFDRKNNKVNFFHSGEFWPLKEYSLTSKEILKHIDTFSEINPSIQEKIFSYARSL